MLIRARRGWEIPESDVTPEHAVRTRRGVLGAGAIAGAAALLPHPASAQWSLFGLGGTSPPVVEKPRAPLIAKRNDLFKPDRAVTDEKDAESYNNYYEFSEGKTLAAAAQALPLEPWTIRLDGMVSKPVTLLFDDLMKKVSLEERILRHRCVEAWAMTVPWTGFPLSQLLAIAEPQAGAKYVVFTTAEDAKTMPGLHKPYYPWPYVDGVTMQEAANELAFVSVGMYGKTLPPQNGAPLRLTLPWKYGFKQVKAIVKIEFTDQKPVSFWEKLNPDEYGFWANVNPAVPHPRWSQAQERLLGSGEMVPTKIWNGYGEFVASMYSDKKTERLFA